MCKDLTRIANNDPKSGFQELVVLGMYPKRRPVSFESFADREAVVDTELEKTAAYCCNDKAS